MLGLCTIVGFVVALYLGGWWWLIAIFNALVWIGNKGKKEQKNQELTIVMPLEGNVSSQKSGDIFERTESPGGANDRVPTSSTSAVDVNTADSDHLISLPGLGAVEAMMILERRASGAPFRSLDELSEFLHLKPHKAAHLKNLVFFSIPDMPVVADANSTSTGPSAVSPLSSKLSSSGRVID